MKNSQTKFFLDSNIDGYYLDEENNLQKVEDMIQVVGAGDGSRILPGKSTDQHLTFTQTELDEIKANPTFYNELLKVRGSGNQGHGLLYNDDGEVYAKRGDMVLRDVNHAGAISDIMGKVESINQNEDSTVYMKDKTLDSQISTKIGLSLDQILKAARTKYNPFGLGNVVQAVRNSANSDTKVSVFTITLTDQNQIWVVGSASMIGSGKIALKDFSTDTILDTGYAKAQTEDSIIPVFVSYTGSLPSISGDISEISKTCDVAIYNSFFKRYFKRLSGVTENIHEIGIEVLEGDPFAISSVNMLVMDEPISEQIFSGNLIAKDSTFETITLPTQLASSDYSVSVTTEVFTRTWCDTKTESTFKINFEDKYTGRVFWSVVYKATT